jgi:hypothetical protein
MLYNGSNPVRFCLNGLRSVIKSAYSRLSSGIHLPSTAMDFWAFRRKPCYCHTMNFVIVCRAKALVGDPDQLIAQIRSSVSQVHSSHSIEINFYRSAQAEQEFYSSCSCSAKSDLAEVDKIFQANFWNKVKSKKVSQLLEYHTFDLLYDYRIVSSTVATSCLLFLTLPPDFSTTEHNAMIEMLAEQKRAWPGLVGTWLGQFCKSNNNFIFLFRLDWDSLAAQQAYFSHPKFQKSKELWLSRGIQLAYASSDLNGLCNLAAPAAKAPV